MKLVPLTVLLFLIFSIPFSKLYGQVKFTLDIDTLCTCVDSTKSALQGAFGLYQQVRLSNASTPKDTLIKELDYIKTQDLVLVAGHYKLIFTPFDTTLPPNEHYFYPYQGMADIQLTCFFFNKKYTSFLSQMDGGKLLSFYSSYHGVTHEEMLIPASVVTITKERGAYYMAYNRCDYYSHELLIVKVQTKTPLIGPPLPPVGPLPILLTEKQVEILRQFEIEVFTSAVKNNLLDNVQALNRIHLGDKLISFQSKWSISESLYQRLSQD
jgi:hypothetical protein